MDFEDLSKFTTEDFVLDKRFREWVTHPDRESNRFWHQFLLAYPQKIEAVKRAEVIVRQMRLTSYTLTNEEASDLWQTIEGNAESPVEERTNDNVVPLHPIHAAETQTTFSKRSRSNLMMKVAAGLLILLLAIPRTSDDDLHEYRTGYGETKRILLADGSEVTLNANSVLRVPVRWDETERNVWLTGEAFFHVKNIKEAVDNERIPAAFVVYSEEVAIRVLGTSFNVNSRREKVKIALETGKVEVLWLDEMRVMAPGELLEVDKQEKAITQDKVPVEAISSWKDNNLLCYGTPVSQLINVIEDQFGYRVVCEDDQLRNIKVSGAIPLDNITVFNQVLSRLIDAEVSVDGKTILITRK